MIWRFTAMTYLDVLKLLEENYCKSGETDKNGIYRYGNGGNTIALVNNNGGWVFRLNGYCGGFRVFLKYSIDKTGRMKNCGKFHKSDVLDLEKIFKRSTMYAVLTPAEEKAFNDNGIYSNEKMFSWKKI